MNGTIEDVDYEVLERLLTCGKKLTEEQKERYVALARRNEEKPLKILEKCVEWNYLDGARRMLIDYALKDNLQYLITYCIDQQQWEMLALFINTSDDVNILRSWFANIGSARLDSVDEYCIPLIHHAGKVVFIQRLNRAEKQKWYNMLYLFLAFIVFYAAIKTYLAN